MRTKSFEYNQEHPNNEIIIKDIKQMSEGAIELDEVALNNLRSEYKQHFSQRAAKAQQRPAQKAGQKNQQKNQHPAQRNKPNQRMQKKYPETTIIITKSGVDVVPVTHKIYSPEANL